MGASERRTAIWYTLCTHRQVTIAYLAEKYHVSPRTIRYDIEILSRTYPIETRVGKNGGIKVADWFQPGRGGLLQLEQMDLLLELYCRLDGEEAVLLGDIIAILSREA